MTLRILHLSDTHFYGDDTLHYASVDTRDHLARLLDMLAGESVDLVVCSGDVSEDGSAESYRRVRGMLAPWAAQRGAQLVWAVGNHDSRAAFRQVLGGDEVDGAVVSRTQVQGLRVLALDSSIPGRGDGALGKAQREWLARELATPAERGTIVVVHHPPIAAQSNLLQALALREDDARALLDLVHGSDVRAILSGHYHLPIVEYCDGIPVIVAPGVANVARSTGDRRTESAVDAFGATIIEITDGAVRAVPFVSAVNAREVFHFDAATVEKIIDAAAPAS